MGALDGIVEQLTAVSESIGLIDLKLDEVRTLIAELRVGVPVTQEEIDALKAKVESLAAATGAVRDEALALE